MGYNTACFYQHGDQYNCYFTRSRCEKVTKMFTKFKEDREYYIRRFNAVPYDLKNFNKTLPDASEVSFPCNTENCRTACIAYAAGCCR